MVESWLSNGVATVEAIAEPSVMPPDALVEYIGKFPNRGSLLVAGDRVESAAGALAAHFQVETAVGSAADARGVLTAALRQIERAGGNRARPLYLRPPDVTLPRAKVPFVSARR